MTILLFVEIREGRHKEKDTKKKTQRKRHKEKDTKRAHLARKTALKRTK